MTAPTDAYDDRARSYPTTGVEVRDDRPARPALYVQGVLHMVLLSLLLLCNAVLHGVIIGRFGIKGNAPPAVFGILYAGLALAVFRDWDHAVLATLVVTAVGLLGLALNFKKLQHDTTVERIVVVVGSATIAAAIYLLFLR